MGSNDTDGQVKGPQRVAVIIPCRDARKVIAATVRACRAIPAVDLIVIVDDGSDDNTAQVARSAGAVAVRHSVPRGRASAMETGVKVVAMRDRSDWPPRLMLFLQPDLGESAVEATGLVEAVIGGMADCAIGVDTENLGNRRSRREFTAARELKATTGWDAAVPLSSKRCLTREAINAVMPFATGYGVDLAMTIDLIVKGFAVVEIPCNFQKVPGLGKRRHQIRSKQYWDLWFAARARRLTRSIVPISQRVPATEQGVGIPYQRRLG